MAIQQRILHAYFSNWVSKISKCILLKVVRVDGNVPCCRSQKVYQNSIGVWVCFQHESYAGMNPESFPYKFHVATQTNLFGQNAPSADFNPRMVTRDWGFPQTSIDSHIFPYNYQLLKCSRQEISRLFTAGGSKHCLFVTPIRGEYLPFDEKCSTG